LNLFEEGKRQILHCQKIYPKAANELLLGPQRLKNLSKISRVNKIGRLY